MRASQPVAFTLFLFAAGCAGNAPPPACPEPVVVKTTETTLPPPPTPAPELKPADDELARLARFAGEWRGEGHGDPGFVRGSSSGSSGLAEARARMTWATS